MMNKKCLEHLIILKIIIMLKFWAMYVLNNWKYVILYNSILIMQIYQKILESWILDIDTWLIFMTHVRYKFIKELCKKVLMNNRTVSYVIWMRFNQNDFNIKSEYLFELKTLFKRFKIILYSHHKFMNNHSIIISIR
jgi:hypothetical protein